MDHPAGIQEPTKERNLTRSHLDKHTMKTDPHILMV